MTKRIVDESLLRQVLEALDTALINDPDRDDGYYQEHITALRSALDGDTELNLNCKSVQKRLAAQWGFVPALDGDAVEPVVLTMREKAEITAPWAFIRSDYSIGIVEATEKFLRNRPQPAQSATQVKAIDDCTTNWAAHVIREWRKEQQAVLGINALVPQPAQKVEPLTWPQICAAMKSVFPGQYDDDNSLEEASESDPERGEITKVVRAIEAAIAAAASAPQPAQKVEPVAWGHWESIGFGDDEPMRLVVKQTAPSEHDNRIANWFPLFALQDASAAPQPAQKVEPEAKP